MQFKTYKAITTYLANEKVDITERWINVIANIKKLTIEEVGLLSKHEFNSLVIETEKELTSITEPKEPIKKFTYNNIEYDVDTSIFDGNVNLMRDYEALTKRFKDKTLELHKHIVALLFYTKGDEVYTTSRYNKNLDIVEELSVEIVFGISKFFFHLLELLKNYFLQFSESKKMLPKMEQLLTIMAEEKLLMKDTQ